VSYRIAFSHTGDVLVATISGSCPKPGALANDIGTHARETAARHLVIDMRRLVDRAGRLRELFAHKSVPRRVAVIDSARNERLYVFAEIDARRRGCTLRRFDDHDSAVSWLLGSPASGR
jgi:hypothetical protein